MKIEIKVEDRAVLDALNRLLAASNDMTPAMEDISGILAEAADSAFMEQRDPATGAPWKPLRPVTVQRRGSSTPILQITGQLVSSIQTDHGPDFAVAGTNKVYARTHQFGAKMGEFGRYSQIGRVRKFGLGTFQGSAGTQKGFPIPWGDIPARPFLGIGDDDKAAILDTINRHLADAVR